MVVGYPRKRSNSLTKFVSDPHPAPRTVDKRSLLQKLAELLHPGPDSTEELIATLSEAEDRNLINTESRIMLEGVLRMAERTAGDAMVPTPRMDVLDIDAPYPELLHTIIGTGHSRFPVYEGERDNIIGILLAKDLLKLQRAPELNLRALLRPAVFIPESKGLNDLLRDFRGNHNHLAVVIDEFGRMAGLITIEDVLEEIVGEIEDEFDDDDDEDGDIFALADGTWRISGDTPIARLNEEFDLQLSDADVETVAGLIVHEMGHVPRRGEFHTLQGWRFEVLHGRGGVVKWFKARKPGTATG